ncbi:MAG: hypothetical protein AB4290_03040 [Spirulina sp.]
MTPKIFSFANFQKKLPKLPYRILGISLIFALFIVGLWVNFWGQPHIPVDVKMSARGAKIVRAYWNDPKTHPHAYEPIIVNPFQAQQFKIKIEPLGEKNPAADAYKVAILQIQTPENEIDWSKATFTGEQWTVFNHPIASQGQMPMAYSENEKVPKFHIPFGEKESISATLNGNDVEIVLLTGRDQGKARVTVNDQVREVDLFNKRQGISILSFPATAPGDEKLRNYRFNMRATLWRKLRFSLEEKFEGRLNISEVRINDRILQHENHIFFIIPKTILYQILIKHYLVLFSIFLISFFLIFIGLNFIKNRYTKLMQAILLFSLISLGIWWTVKSALFEKLAYSHDLLFFIQTASSIFKDRPILFHNRFGNYAGIHNNYLTLFFYPLTAKFGAYGIFIIHTVLIGLAIFAIAHLANASSPRKQWRYCAAIAGLIFGPIGFWIYDHPVYGFNPDLLYLPLSILLVASLVKQSKAAWFWSVLIILVKQDGAVLCCSIYLLFEFLQPLPQLNGSKTKQYIRKFLKLALISMFWLVIFAIGMLVMSLMQYDPSESRLVLLLQAIAEYTREPEFSSIVFTGFRNLFLLSLGGFLFYLVGLPIPSLIYTLICSIPLIVVDSISSFLYGLETFPDNFIWEPRFVKLWSLLIAGIMISIFQAKDTNDRPKNRKQHIFKLSLVVLICLMVQHYSLLEVTRYHWLEDRFVYSLAGKRSGDVIDTQVRGFLDCLANNIPHETSILTNTFLFAQFHQYDLVWPGFIDTAWEFPKIILCSSDRFQPHDQQICFQDRSQTQKIRPDFMEGTYYNLHYSYLPEFEETFKSCRDRTAVQFKLRQDARNY